MTVPPSQVCSRPPPVEWRELIRQQACLRHAGPLTTDLCCAESARRCRPRAPPSPRQAFGDRTYERIRIDIELWNRRLLHTARSRGQWVVNLRVDSFAPFHYLFCRPPMTWEHKHSSSGRGSMNTLGKMQPSVSGPDDVPVFVVQSAVFHTTEKRKDSCF